MAWHLKSWDMPLFDFIVLRFTMLLRYVSVFHLRQIFLEIFFNFYFSPAPSDSFLFFLATWHSESLLLILCHIFEDQFSGIITSLLSSSEAMTLLTFSWSFFHVSHFYFATETFCWTSLKRFYVWIKAWDLITSSKIHFFLLLLKYTFSWCKTISL